MCCLKSLKRFLQPTMLSSRGMAFEPESIARAIAASWHLAAFDRLDESREAASPAPITHVPASQPPAPAIEPSGVRMAGREMRKTLIPHFTTLPSEARALGVGNASRYAASALEAQRRTLLRLAAQSPGAFRLLDTFGVSTDDARVRFGSPIKLDDYDAIPVYVGRGGQTTLAFAYRSRSQACWRRFAGRVGDIFWKGKSEHMQNFDWRLQRELDRIYETRTPLALAASGLHSLADLGLSSSLISPRWDGAMHFITQIEDALQSCMTVSSAPFDERDRMKAPATLIDFWWAGHPDDAYGRHANLMVLSRDAAYLYCIALTAEGIFPKFVQDAGTDRLNSVGAPDRGVPIPKSSSWVFTPIVEYSSQQDEVARQKLSDLEIHGTIVFGGNRVRIIGAHASGRSPFYELSNGLDGMCRLLRQDCYDAVEQKLSRIIARGGALPLSRTPPERPEAPEGEVEERLHQLLEAFHGLSISIPDPETSEGRQRMFDYHIGTREVALFRRYRGFLDGWRGYSGGEVPLFAMQLLVQRLRRVAQQDVEDQHSGTVLMTQ
ncbi:MAG: hypothetical protein AB1529_00255 [Candidatus Micrarchaeota archaeon]